MKTSKVFWALPAFLLTLALSNAAIAGATDFDRLPAEVNAQYKQAIALAAEKDFPHAIA
ncbi:hypothetical protein GYK49_14375, partial [Lactobacillus paracasei]|nr:hypothetical protein [Lacticaseibacillus paracasei]